TIPNLSVAADEIVLFVTGAALPNGVIGRELHWSYSSAGSPAWLDTVKGRGQTGALAATPIDVGPWGAAVAFSTPVTRNLPPGAPASNQFDFLSVAEHELIHVLGFQSDEPAFARLLTPDNHFAGPNVVAVNGSPAPLVAGDTGEIPDHWNPSIRVD